MHRRRTPASGSRPRFEHDTARPVNGYPAPHLHTHVVVFNMTEDARGQARSLQPYELFKIQSMATAVYQNQLEYELRQAGYKIERGLNHAPEIKGYSREYLEAESLRNAEIQRELERARTIRRRGHQQHQAPEPGSKVERQSGRTQGDAQTECSRVWRPARVAWSPRPQNGIHDRLTTDKVQEKAQAAVTFARERLGERSAVFEHFEVIRDALRHVQGKVRLPEIQAELDRQIGERRFETVNHVRPHAPAARYTTPELVQTERDAIERVRAGIAQVRPIANVTIRDIQSKYGKNLNEDQVQLVHQSLASRDQIFGIQGGAGTGKTTALRAIKEVAEEKGYKAIGLGPTSRAAKGLKEGGLHAETLQAFLTRGDQRIEDTRPRLFFVDESSLASGRQIRDFLGRLQSQDRVLLIGDVRQHQSVEAGRIFDELQRAGMNTATLQQDRSPER